MNRIEVFQILGIEATEDERAIRNAYRERLAVTNPKDDQEGFKRLRRAYSGRSCLRMTALCRWRKRRTAGRSS